MTDPATTSSTTSSEKMTEAQRAVEEFWPEMTADIHRIKHVEPGNQLLPLARIKKIMKLDEDVKMISAEAPLLFAKAAEIFIQELTMRAWLHTEDNKRRTLQRSDIAMAIAKYDMFDFLIDIVPREEVRPSRREFGPKTSADDTKYYFQLAQQHQLALQQNSANSGSSTAVAGTSGNVVQVQATTATVPQQQPQFQTVQQAAATPQIATIATPGPNIILTNPAAGTLQNATTINPVQLATQGQPIQLMQQVLTPTGEVTHIPIPLNQTQLNFIRTQMQLNQPGAGTATAAAAPQPIIIQAPQLQTTPTIIQTAPGGLFLNAGHIIQHQPQQIQQHQIQQQIQQQQQHQE